MIKLKHPNKKIDVPSLKLTFSPLKIGLPNRKVVFQPSIFRGYVSFREGIPKPTRSMHGISTYPRHPNIYLLRFGGVLLVCFLGSKYQKPQEVGGNGCLGTLMGP